MICHCFGHSIDLALIGKRLGQTASLMVGVPDYDAYVAHLTTSHPDAPPLSRTAFYRNRQAARFGATGAGLRCC